MAAQMSMSWILALCVICAFRIYAILPSNTPKTQTRRKVDRPSSLAVFLGSGGHSVEALLLVSSLNFQQYSPRKYIVSEGDLLSAQKATSLETMKSKAALRTGTPIPEKFTILTIPRAREVHQSLFTTAPSALRSFLACLFYMTISPILNQGSWEAKFADVLILNGPGTCVVLCMAAYVNKFLRIPCPKLVYVESFARVNSLSLSGKLLRPLVDKFVVQWPQLVRDDRRDYYSGWLV